MALPKLGSGKRFEKLASSIEAKGKSPEEAQAIAASIGRKKFGGRKFQALALAGRHMASHGM